MFIFKRRKDILESKQNIVVGGGVIGLLTAWYLVLAGEPVIVVERGQVGRESSWAGGGILFPLNPDRYPSLMPLVVQSNEDYPTIVLEAGRRSGVDAQLILSGLLLLDRPGNHKDGGGYYSGAKTIAYEVLARLEPRLVWEGDATYFPAAQVRNPRLLIALRMALQEMGVVFSEFCEVLGFEERDGRLVAVQTTRGRLPAERCVVATGAWAGGMLTGVGLRLPIKPIKGEMIVFSAQPGLLSHIVVSDYQYLIPRADGRVLVGSTVEDVGFNKEPTARARDSLFEAATEMVPSLARLPIEHHWAGLRPGSPDDTPFIGEHPDIKGLFVCAGHHRNGFASGPASARLVVDMLLHRPLSVDPSPFRLDRSCPDWPMPA